MKKAFILPLVFFFSVNVFSQAPATKEHVKELLEVTGAGKMGVQVMQLQMKSFKDLLPQVPDMFWDKMLEMAKPETLVDLVIPVYVKHYTDEEVMELIRFYKTPIGKKVIEKTPLVMQECTVIGGKWGEKIAQDIIEKLKAEGYTKEGGGE